MNFKKLNTLHANIRPPTEVDELGEGTPAEEALDAQQGEIDPSHAGAPPTARDAKQAITHHLSSIKYNMKHSAAHDGEAAHHSTKLLNLLKNVPGFAEHARKV
jgi:hypothetical protein